MSKLRGLLLIVLWSLVLPQVRCSVRLILLPVVVIVPPLISTVVSASLVIVVPLVHEITVTLLKFCTINQQVHCVVQVIPYVSKGRSHRDYWFEASYVYFIILSQDIN